MADWDKIKAEYVHGGITFRQIVTKYGVSLSSVNRHSRSGKWADLKHQAEAKANTKLVEKSAKDKYKSNESFWHTVDVFEEKFRQAIIQPDFFKESKDYRAAAAVLKDLKDIRGIKSDGDVREQEARISRLLKDTVLENEKGEYGVVLMPDVVEVMADE